MDVLRAGGGGGARQKTMLLLTDGTPNISPNKGETRARSHCHFVPPLTHVIHWNRCYIRCLYFWTDNATEP